MMPLTTFLMASRLRLARAMATEVQKAGIACYEWVQTRQRPIVVSRDLAPVKQVVEKGSGIDVRRFLALRHHRMDPGRYITEGHFLTFNRNTGVDNSAMHRGWLADRDEVRVWLAPNSHNAHNLRYCEAAGAETPAGSGIAHHPLAWSVAPNNVGPPEAPN